MVWKSPNEHFSQPGIFFFPILLNLVPTMHLTLFFGHNSDSTQLFFVLRFIYLFFR